MRLSLQAQQIIKNTTKEVFGIDALVKVFGSRIDDDARGGDIDLLVELHFVMADSERKTLQLINWRNSNIKMAMKAGSMCI